jgi:hypothetical protein
MISPVEASFDHLNKFIISYFNSNPSLLIEGNENSPTKIPQLIPPPTQPKSFSPSSSQIETLKE